jgi:glycerol-3-phosphate acyltransferase PlsY
MKRILQRVLQAAVYLLCFLAAVKSSADLTGTEAEGGTVTGPMLGFATVGFILFFVVALLTLLWSRVAAIGALIPCAMCFPVYIYRTLPHLFRFIFPGEYKQSLPATFIWHGWSIMGMLASVIVVYFFYRSLLSRPHTPVSTAKIGGRC